MNPNPCLTCGACCARFRVSFYWAEASDATPGGVPVELTIKVNDFRRAMKAAAGENPRCLALQGTIGAQVSCAIYERRASVCRDFSASYLNGHPVEGCDQARAAWGLAPLTPESWPCPGNFPRLPKAA